MRPRNKLEMFEAKHRIGAMGSKEVSKGQCGKHGRSSSFMCCLLCVVEHNENVRGAGRTQHCIHFQPLLLLALMYALLFQRETEKSLHGFGYLFI